MQTLNILNILPYQCFIINLTFPYFAQDYLQFFNITHASFKVHTILLLYSPRRTGLPSGSGGKESTCNVTGLGSIPGSGRSLKEGVETHSNILAWKTRMDRGAWLAAVHRVTKSRTQLNDQAQHTEAELYYHSQNSSSTLPASFQQSYTFQFIFYYNVHEHFVTSTKSYGCLVSFHCY